jgi:hypothetical protein
MLNVLEVGGIHDFTKIEKIEKNLSEVFFKSRFM